MADRSLCPSFLGRKLCVVLVSAVCAVGSAWSNDTAICTGIPGWLPRDRQQVVSDGSGGAIIIWRDGRSGAYEIYGQRVAASGAVQWPASGVPIGTWIGDESYPQLISDGAGGAMVTFETYGGDIYAQRVSTTGAIEWTTAICTTVEKQQSPQLTTDSSGGAIITWEDYRGGLTDIYAQRVDASGAVQWTLNGVPVCTAADYQSWPQLTSASSGGAIITWHDFRGDVYAQRLDASGSPQWTANGTAICTAVNSQGYPHLTSDTSGGAIITWFDNRSGTSYDIYAQRVKAGGAVEWVADGTQIRTAGDNPSSLQLASDGSGGAIVTWEEYRNGTDEIYVQRINPNGAVQWTTNGVSVCTAANTDSGPQLTSDGSGGAIITWRDGRSGTNDIYAQRVSASGAVQWAANGAPICTAANTQGFPQLTSDGSGGAIVTWPDYRNSNYDIYAQRVDSVGMLPVVLSRFGVE